ncbi:DNA helicase II, partial [Escherichia coli]|nr:DNA helicase II [Escherichia coli]
SKGRKYSDFAVLYRMNAQSNSIEQSFSRSGVPYRLIGGHRFYDREEIKDILAYLQFINNPSDDIRLRRIINKPKRGIGD